MRNVGGSVNQLHWVTNYESLAALEALGAKVQTDAGYNALLAEAWEQGLFFGNTIVDDLYQSIP